MKRVTENLKNQNEHYLYPFFWQHGESKEVLKEYIDKMLEQGIYNMCIESRPHPDFLEAGWWQTMDDLVDMAKANHMKIWILDDAKFPTGYANGKVPDELKKRYLAYRRFDIAASASQVEINLSQFVDMREVMKDQRHQQDQFFKAILVENDITNPTAFHEDTLKDVSDCYKNQTLSLHLEKKHYSLFIIYITLCGEEATQEYLDPMRQEATQINYIISVQNKQLKKDPKGSISLPLSGLLYYLFTDHLHIWQYFISCFFIDMNCSFIFFFHFQANYHVCVFFFYIFKKLTSDTKSSAFWLHIQIFDPDTLLSKLCGKAFGCHGIPQKLPFIFKHISFQIWTPFYACSDIILKNLIRSITLHCGRCVKYPHHIQYFLFILFHHISNCKFHHCPSFSLFCQYALMPFQIFSVSFFT